MQESGRAKLASPPTPPQRCDPAPKGVRFGYSTGCPRAQLDDRDGDRRGMGSRHGGAGEGEGWVMDGPSPLNEGGGAATGGRACPTSETIGSAGTTAGGKIASMYII